MAITKGLQKSAKTIIDNADDFERSLDDLVKKGEVEKIKVKKVLDELEEVAGINYKIDNFISRGIKNGKTIGNISKKIIVRELRNVTDTATEIARALDKGKIKLVKLDETDFYNAIKRPGEKIEDLKDVLAAQIHDEVFIKNTTSLDKAFGEIVHEGKHALDYTKGLFKDIKLLREESKQIVHDKISMEGFVDIMSDSQVIELRARIAEREFQIAAKQPLDFQSASEMISFIFEKY